MERIFKLKKEYPSHRIGDLIYKANGCYNWENPPFHKVDADLVENTPEYFEEIIVNWEKGENIYFITLNGNVIDEKFEPSRHSSLAHYGNAFKNEIIAKQMNDRVKLILSDINNVILYNEDILKVVDLIKNKKYKEAIKELNKKIEML